MVAIAAAAASLVLPRAGVPRCAADEPDVVVIGSGIGGLCCGALLARYGRRVTVLEFNEPRITDGPLRRAVSTLAVPALPALYAKLGPLYDVIVSFSGIEHDGLGRCGDPLNIDGDL